MLAAAGWHRRGPEWRPDGPAAEPSAIGIDHRMTLAPVDLLASIVSARATSFSGFDALAVNDRGAGTGVAADTLTIPHHQLVVQAFPRFRRRESE